MIKTRRGQIVFLCISLSFALFAAGFGVGMLIHADIPRELAAIGGAQIVATLGIVGGFSGVVAFLGLMLDCYLDRDH